MNKLLKSLSFLLFFNYGLNAQTTQDEYLYASGGYLKANSLGIGEKQGYHIIPFNELVDSYYSTKWSSEYSISLLIRNDNPTDSISAIILTKGNSSYCIPHPHSDPVMINKSLDDFPEFWNSYNEAILFHFIQDAVWGNLIKQQNDGKVILDVDFEIANYWEHEPTPEYAEHWSEFLYNTEGREMAYNALAEYPNFECDEKAFVMVKFRIESSGRVSNAEIVTDHFFKGREGKLVGTDTSSVCLWGYAIDLIKQQTFLPSNQTTNGYVLFEFN